jgi:hypothetical protein
MGSYENLVPGELLMTMPEISGVAKLNINKHRINEEIAHV